MNLKSISSINEIILKGSSSKFNTTVSGVIIDSRNTKNRKKKFINIFKVDDGSQYINFFF